MSGLDAELFEALRRDVVAELRGFGVPDRRVREVPRHALAPIINGAERRRGRPEALLGRRFPEHDRLPRAALGVRLVVEEDPAGQVLPINVARPRRAQKGRERAVGVLAHALGTLELQQAEPHVRARLAQLRGAPEEPRGLAVVLREAHLALLVHAREQLERERRVGLDVRREARARLLRVVFTMAPWQSGHAKRSLPCACRRQFVRHRRQIAVAQQMSAVVGSAPSNHLWQEGHWPFSKRTMSRAGQGSAAIAT